MATNYTKLSNVIGAPFNEYVLKQLYTRAARNSTQTRTNEEVLFLANKTAWARLVSSVNVNLEGSELTNYYQKLGIADTLPDFGSDSLAKNWVLEAGLSSQDGNGIKLRAGIGPNGAYGIGGTEEVGFRPIPGLTSIQVETTGRLGSLRQATIQFKVWNMNQLNTIEALYFRLGYSMLLEWGHTQYFNNNNTFVSSDIYGIDDPFNANTRKEFIQQSIAKKAKLTNGNYDGMLGIVSNFNWSFNQEGGYDCTVRLVGLGAIIDSTKINQVYQLPQGLLKEYKKNQKAIQDQQAYLAQLAQNNLHKKDTSSVQDTNFPPVPTNLNQLEIISSRYDSNWKDNNTFESTNAYYKASEGDSKPGDNKNLTPDYYYMPVGKGDTADYIQKLKNLYGGLYKGSSSRAKGNFLNFIPYNTPSISINIAALDTWMKQYVTKLSITPVSNTTINYNYPIQLAFDDKIKEKVSIGASTGGAGVNTSQISEAGRIDNGAQATLNYYKDLNPKNADTNLDIPGGTKRFYFSITYNLSPTSQNPQNFWPSRRQVVEALGTWFDGLSTDTYVSSNSRTITDVQFRTEGNGVDKSVVVTGKSKITVKGVQIKTNANNPYQTQDVEIEFTFETNDTGLLLNGQAAPQIGITRQATQQANQGNTNSTADQASSNQVDSPEGFQSALQAMLVVIKTQAQAAPHPEGVEAQAISILEQTALFFKDGIMDGVLSSSTTVPNTNSNGIPLDSSQDNFIKYAKKGFNSNLMVDPTLYDQIKDVNFADLCKAYIVKYPQGSLEGAPDMTSAPVYIPLGYLLAFLNNMCLIYDTIESLPSTGVATGTNKRPYFYIDFNPETNFCLTSPQQLSVDPLTCLIPFNATDEQYKKIFPSTVKLDPIFKPQSQNVVTGILNGTGLKFKTSFAYQGKTMSILLNVDYLLGIIKSFVANDAEHAVNLQPFLQRVLVDVNKCLGNVNLFRVAYRDDSNTVQIQDDQWVPSLVGEELSISSQDTYLSRLKNQTDTSGLLPIYYDPNVPGQLPIYGQISLARQFQLKTVMSTKLASMIAISAQAQTGSVNSKDHSSLSWMNKNFSDRYKKYIVNPSNGPQGTNNNSKNKTQTKSNDQIAAEMFDNHVATIYSNTSLFSADKIEQAKNYYIERMSGNKATDPITSAAPFIPVELELTLDGISGIIMGNAFTIPEDRLPLSLRGENGKTKVAFIVTGLINTIEKNEWLTKIKGQMIKLREEVNIPIAAAIVNAQQISTTVVATESTSTRNTNLFLLSNAAAASNYLFGSAQSKLDAQAPAHENWGGLQARWQNNNAWDLFVPAGTPVYAITSGTVSGIGFSENFKTVWGYKFTLNGIDNSFFYTHLDSVIVASGATVQKGDLLGYVGQWPSDYVRLSKASHLHLGLKFGRLSNYIDNTGKFI